MSTSAQNDIVWKKGICGICPAACWVEAGYEEDKIVELREDPDHALGMICKRGQHAPEIIYSEHRLRQPMKRVGPKGSHQFEPISWDEAYDTIVENLNKIKQESGAEATAVYTGRGAFELSLCDMFQPKGVKVSSASNVLFPFGSPNTMGVGALCYVSFAMMAPHVTMGRMLVNMFTDIENAEMLLIWGANPATDSPPLDMYRLEAAAKRGADLVGIDPRRSESIQRTSAQWLPIRPGTDGALALSLIEVLIEEELYDEDFVENWTHGFDELCQYVQHFTPEVAEKITGVGADDIRDLARRIANANGACPVMYTGLEYSNTGLQAIRAVHILFALAGHLDVPGGVGLSMLGDHFPINRECNQENPDIDLAVARDRFPLYSHYRGESHAMGLVDAVLKKDPYHIRGLIVHGASLLTSWPQTQVWRETLSKLDFMVCIDRQLTADAAYADIVLPATTMFEIDSYAVYGGLFRLREKMVEPVGEARNDYLIMAELAERLGYGHLYPQSEDAMIRQALVGSGYSLEDVKEAGGWVSLKNPMMEYKKWEKGGLREDKKPGFDTPTGKFEIWSTVLEDFGYEPLPKYVEPKEGPIANPAMTKHYPLVFNSGARTHTEFRSQFHNIKGLCKENPEPVVEMNTHDAQARGIQSGDLVEVSTARGQVPFRAVVSEDIVRGAIECNMGGGVPNAPQAWQEWNANLLTDVENFDEISGFPVYKALLCEIRKLQGAEEGTEAHWQSKSMSRSSSVLGEQSGSGLSKSAAAKVERDRSDLPQIYLDNNATTQVSEKVRAAMIPFLGMNSGNPSSLHQYGKSAREALDTARRSVARLINTLPKRIIFTAGGSESDNLAIKGVAFANAEKGKHIITCKIEHPAVLQSCEFLARIGYEITYLDVDDQGMVSEQALGTALREDTVLVSLMLANNEVGSIQNIRRLCELAHEKGALFHCDAVQAIGKISVDVKALNVDLLSISAHKFHGPKGVGVLYKKKGVKIEPLIHGGKQEAQMRAGTENIPGIVGMGKAAELAIVDLRSSEQVSVLRDRLQLGILALIPGARVNGCIEQRLPNTLNMTLPELRGESLVVALDQHGICLSSGSACKTGSPKPTHVLMAMGRSDEQAHCSVRFSLSAQTTEQDIERTLEALKAVLLEMATTVRFLSCK
ncbi:MAG: aminotransferase V [Alteromonadaceae bacterium]|nr:MAG: aminotransferase V [Alteromonadaceae bacterium]